MIRRSSCGRLSPGRAIANHRVEDGEELPGEGHEGHLGGFPGTPMALSEIELKRCEKAIAAFMDRRRPPPEIRSKLDLAYRITGQSVELFEIRPDWQDKTKTMEAPVAKATFIRTQNHWKVFWMRRDLKWHRYEPNQEVKTLEAFLNVVDRDEYCCFFG